MVDAKAAIEQARWLYEQHEKRAEGARARATAVLTLAGTLVALAPKALPPHSACWLVGVLVLAVALAWSRAGRRSLR